MDLKNKEKIDKELEKRNIKLPLWSEMRESFLQQKKLCDSLKNQYNKMLLVEYDLIEQKKLKQLIKFENQKLKILEEKWQNILEKIPVCLHASVPIGKNSAENKIIYQKGEIKFVKHHYQMNIFHSSSVIGTRLVILKDSIAKLERALICFMMDSLSSEGFQEFSIPYFINETACRNSGNFIEKENMFQVEDKFLIPTGEVTLVNLISHNISLKELPIKFCTVSDCFRREAGAAGKDTKGLVRLHQFKKCEMVCFTTSSESYKMLDKMLKISCKILEDLEIPYRYIVLCSGDTSIKSAKTYDIEIPIGNTWREVASISNCENFQTYRMKIKCKETTELLHSLNGSALAIGRTLASLLEVFFEAERNIVKIPACLWKYCNFQEIKV